MKTFKQPLQSTPPNAADNIALYRAYILVTLVCRPHIFFFFGFFGPEAVMS